MNNDLTICRNCSDEVTGKFCGNCGQVARLKRVDFHYVSHEIQHLLHFEKGLLYTLKALLLRPGRTVKEFLLEDRNRLVKPVIFIIITSLVYTTIDHFFHIEAEYINYNINNGPVTTGILQWIQNHYGYTNIMLGVVIGLWIKVFFKKYAYNFYEILVLLCFVMGMGMLFAAGFALADGLFKIKLMLYGGYIGSAYCAWAIGQFFDGKKIMSYVKSLIAYALGMLSFTMSACLIGLIIDGLMKH
ncbi:MAG: DUF3667 domain-containing protein [Mucilaginibacter sp.]|nr:DUF3667 domain-containing protein [Mucilaginibacter sp.]